MKKKKIINVLIIFFIFHKNNVKTFLNWILNQYRAVPVNMTLINQCFVIRQPDLFNFFWVCVFIRKLLLLCLNFELGLRLLSGKCKIRIPSIQGQSARGLKKKHPWLEIQSMGCMKKSLPSHSHTDTKQFFIILLFKFLFSFYVKSTFVQDKVITIMACNGQLLVIRHFRLTSGMSFKSSSLFFFKGN